MAFALAGSVITQSGTDTAATVITGLQAIAGVTSVSYSTYTRIYIPYKLNITGSMTTDSTVGLSMTRGGTFANEITIGSGASWTAKEVRNLNGYNYYYQLPSLDFNNAALSGSIWSSSSFNAIIVNGGTMDFANITINGNGGYWWNGGTIRFRDVITNAQGLSSVADTQFTTQSGTPTLDIIGWKVIGGKIFIGTANITNFKGVQPVFMQRGFGTSVNSFVLQDFVGGGGNYGDLSAYANPNYEARNLGIGTSTTYFPWISGEANSRGTIRATSDIDLSLTNNLGANVDGFISYLKDNATGAPTGFTTNNYYINTATGNSLSQKILIGVLVASAGAAASFVKRSATQTNDLFAFNVFDYNHNILTTQAFNLAGTGVKSATAIAIADTNVTLTKANALAKLASSFTVNTSTNTITVTASSTLDDVYDALKAYKCQAVQANLEYPTLTTLPVAASGSSLVTAMSIVVNSGVTLSDGTKFTSLTTSGTVTSAGVISTDIAANVTTTGTLSSGAAITGNVTQATPINITGVTITGNLTYNTNSPITITLTDCSISGTVSNSGSGAVTISLANSTIGTVGSNVTSRLVTSLNLTGLTAGSSIYVANGSGTQVAYVASSGTSYTLDTTGGTGTWTWKVARYGFLPQSGTHLPAAASTSATIVLSADPYITQATVGTVSAYTTLQNPDRIYDYAAYFETTNSGISLERIASKAASQVSLGSYPLMLNASGAAWSLASGTLTLNITTAFVGGVTMTGGLTTAGAITLNAQSTAAGTYASISGNTIALAGLVNYQPLVATTSITGFPTSGAISNGGSINFGSGTTYTPTGDFSATATTFTGTLTVSTATAKTFTATSVFGSLFYVNVTGGGTLKILRAGTTATSAFIPGAGVNVRVNVVVASLDGTLLSTYILKNGVTDLGWVAQAASRTVEAGDADTFVIYAIAYGFQSRIVNAVGSNPTSFTIDLSPEPNVDTTLPTGPRNAILATLGTNLDAYNRLVMTLSADLRQYSPEEVLNALQYYTVVSGELIAQVVVYSGGSVIDGFTIIQGGIIIGTAGFYAQVNNSVTTVSDLGILVPLYIAVLPAVYVADPTYTPVRKNTSGIVLQYAPWTKQTADLSPDDMEEIAALSATAVWTKTLPIT